MCVCACTWMGLRQLTAGDIEDAVHCQWKDAACRPSETGGGEMNHIPLSSRSSLSPSSLVPATQNGSHALGGQFCRKGAKENTLTHSLPCWVLDALCLGLLSWLRDCFPGPLDGAADSPATGLVYQPLTSL